VAQALAITHHVTDNYWLRHLFIDEAFHVKQNRIDGIRVQGDHALGILANAI
jgi:hypothetical protein